MIAALLLALVGVALLSLCLGERWDSPVDVVRALLGQQVAGVSFNVTVLRLPRVLTALLTGVAFGLGGAVFQTMLRNPLASPDIIGISAGSSAVAVVAITMFGVSGAALSVLAVLGGLLVAAAIYALSWQRGVHGARLVLTGIAVGAMLDSVISYALTRTQVYQATEALRWLTGSLNSAFWDGVGPSRPRPPCWSRSCWSSRVASRPCSSATTRRPASASGPTVHGWRCWSWPSP
ncbi:FecCD family ABC transporter permease [Cellulomonas soli]